MTPFQRPEEDDDDDYGLSELFAFNEMTRQLRITELGWGRILPPRAYLMLHDVHEMREEEIETSADDVWGDAAHDREITMDVVRDLHRNVSDEDELRRLAEAERRSALEHDQRRREAFTALCERTAVPEPHHVADLPDFLTALGVFLRFEMAGVAWVECRADELDPLEVLALTESERTFELQIRGHNRFVPLMPAVARLFRESAPGTTEITTSLARLAKAAGVEEDPVRGGLLGAIQAGLLSSNRALERLETHRVFTLALTPSDSPIWEAFALDHGLSASAV